MKRFLMASVMFGLFLAPQARAEVQSLVVPLNTGNPYKTTDEVCEQVRKPLSQDLRKELGASNLLSQCLNGYLVIQYDNEKRELALAWSLSEDPMTFTRQVQLTEERTVDYLVFAGSGVETQTATYAVTRDVTETRTASYSTLKECNAGHKTFMIGLKAPAGKIAASACYLKDNKPQVLWVALCDSLACYAALQGAWSPLPAPEPF
jgi:hypothetical protein